MTMSYSNVPRISSRGCSRIEEPPVFTFLSIGSPESSAILAAVSPTLHSFLRVSLSYRSRLTLVPGISPFCTHRYVPHQRSVHLVVDVMLVQLVFSLSRSHISSAPHRTRSDLRESPIVWSFLYGLAVLLSARTVPLWLSRLRSMAV